MNKKQNQPAGLSEIFKIRKIKTELKITSSDGLDNFREFQRIYGPLFSKKLDQTRKLLNSRSKEDPRPPMDIKTIHLAMPPLGSESAIINNKKTPIKPFKPFPIKVKAKGNNKKLDTKEKSVTTTQSFIKKLSQMEQSLRSDPKAEVHRSTSTVLDLTNKEIQVASEQLELVKKLIQQKQEETQTFKEKPKKAKKNEHKRHRKCHEKQYVSCLHSMQKRIKELENKYLKRPQVAYRSVHDNFTQYSKSIETIYQNEVILNKTKTKKVLEAEITEMDDAVQTDMAKDLKERQFTELKDNNDQIKDQESIDLSFETCRNNRQQTSSDQIGDGAFDFGEALLDKYISLQSVPATDSPEGYLSKIQKELYTKQAKRQTTQLSPFCSNQKCPLPDFYSEAVKNFLVGKDLDDLSSCSSACSSPVRGRYKQENIKHEHAKQVTTKYDQPKHVKVEHVLAKNWSGDHKEEIEEPVKGDNYSNPKTTEESTKNKHNVSSNTEKSEKSEEPLKKLFQKVQSLPLPQKDNSMTDIQLNYSFKKQYTDKDYHYDSFSAVIDTSEKQLMKYRNIKQDMMDVNAFCEKICSLVKTDDEEEDYKTDTNLQQVPEKIEKNITVADETENVFENSKLQDSVMKSCYLMKEFNITPKIFREESSLFCKKNNKILDFAKKCTASGDKNISSLFDNLQNALENSIYKIDTVNVVKCESQN